MTLRLALLAAALAAAAPALADPSPAMRLFVAGAEAPHGDLAARRLLGAATDAAARPAAHVSPGEAQLAAALGVDPAAFTLPELARLKALAERRSDDD